MQLKSPGDGEEGGGVGLKERSEAVLCMLHRVSFSI